MPAAARRSADVIAANSAVLISRPARAEARFCQRKKSRSFTAKPGHANLEALPAGRLRPLGGDAATREVPIGEGFRLVGGRASATQDAEPLTALPTNDQSSGGTHDAKPNVIGSMGRKW